MIFPNLNRLYRNELRLLVYILYSRRMCVYQRGESTWSRGVTRDSFGSLGPRCVTVKRRLKVAALPCTRVCVCVYIYVHARVCLTPRREFSFHGQKDNPSLCHFSSVFLSHRLIELLRTAATDLCHVSFSPVSPFHRHTIDHETVVSRDTIRIYIHTPFLSISTMDEIGFRHP